jgi:hypothetical protein
MAHGYPAKNEAVSVLGKKHSHAPRVLELLREARAEAARKTFPGLGTQPIGFELTLACPRDRHRGDGTNYLGGVADVLEYKAHRRDLEHLDDLATFSLYVNDRQIARVVAGICPRRRRWTRAGSPPRPRRGPTLSP